MSDPSIWKCPTCRVEVATRFCPRCGEEPIPPKDLALRNIAAKALHALTSVDARAMRSVRVLLRHPGRLTVAWIEGIRKPYVAPFQLFLLANVAFFAVQWATSESVLSSPLDSHLHHQDWSEWAQARVARRLEATQRTLADYTPVFDRAVVLNAKSLILLMSLALAALLPVAFLRERRPLMVHVVFSLHLYTFLLLLFCAALVAARLSAWLGFGGLEAPRVDNVITFLNLAACACYLHQAIGPVYGAVGAARVLKAMVLTFLVAFIVLGYRFVIFVVTLYAV